MKLPVDRGWAWVVTFACGGMFAWTMGNEKSRGIIFVELTEIYPEKSATAIMWIFSLAQLVNRMSGPLNGMLLARTSSRFVGMLGVGIMATSLVIFANISHTEYMYVVYGVFYGCGNGMVMLTVLTAFAPYFEKRKALSLGLTSAGSGVGSVIIPLLLRKLFDSYSFSGAMLLYAGVCLQTMILASLLRPFSYYSKWVKPASDGCTREEDNSNNNNNNNHVKAGQGKFRNRSHSLEPSKPGLAPDHPVATFLSTPNNARIAASHRDQSLHISSLQILACSAQNFEGSCNIPGQLRSFSQSGEDIEERQSENKGFNWRLVYNPWTLVLGFSALLFCSGISISAQCLPPLGKELGVSKELVSVLMSASGAAEIPMRILNGWFADKRFVSASTQVGLCMLIMGVSALLCATLSNTAGIAIVLFGGSCAGAAVFSLIPVTCLELFGKDQVQSAMAINFVFMGVANIISTFGAGGIYDATGKWRYTFYFIGTLPIIGSLLMFSITLALRCKHEPAEDNSKKLHQ